MIDAYRSATLINARGTAAPIGRGRRRVAGLGHRPRRDRPAPPPEQPGLAPPLRPRSLLAAAPHRRRRRAPAAVDAAQGRQWHVRLSPRCWCSASRSSRWAWSGSSATPDASTCWPRCAPGGRMTLVVWGVLELVAFALGRDAAEVLSMKGAKIGLLLVILAFGSHGRDGLARPQPFRPRGLGLVHRRPLPGPVLHFRGAADGGRGREHARRGGERVRRRERRPRAPRAKSASRCARSSTWAPQEKARAFADRIQLQAVREGGALRIRTNRADLDHRLHRWRLRSRLRDPPRRPGSPRHRGEGPERARRDRR